MSEAEKLEQFRSVLLTAMNLFRESRKDVEKLQAKVIALENALAAITPDWETHYQKYLNDAERLVASRKTPALLGIERLTDEVIGLLSLGDKQKEN